MNANDAIRTILASGLIAGVCDLVGAIVSSIHRGVTPFRILQAVASGWLGMRSYELGYRSAALGLVSHFTIALGWAALFLVLSRGFTLLTERPVIVGAIYGIVVYWLMQLVVLPLSNYPHRRLTSWSTILIGNVVHIICVGLPIALVTQRMMISRRS
jgi:uncharacterized membrane protein YagU involved in acid resistance